MLDIKFVRENPDIVKQNIKNKFQDEKLPLVDEVIELYGRQLKAKQDAEALQASRNALSKQIGALKGKAKKEPEKAAEYEAQAAEIQAQVTAESEQREQLEKEADELAVQRPGDHDEDPQHHRPLACPSARTTPAMWRFSASARPRCPTSTCPTTPTSWSAFNGLDLDQLPAGSAAPASTTCWATSPGSTRPCWPTPGTS